EVRLELLRRGLRPLGGRRRRLRSRRLRTRLLRGRALAGRLGAGLAAVGRRLAASAALALAGLAGGEQLERLVDRDVLGRVVLPRRGVRLAVLDVGPEAALVQLDGIAALGMRSDDAQRLAATARLLLRQQLLGTLDADAQHVVLLGERGVGALVLDV